MRIVKKEIKFHAEYVETVSEEYTLEHKVVGVYFGEGDPEIGGQHWNFTQSVGDDENEGICTVKEIQQVTIYGGIEKFIINKEQLVCVFDSESAMQTKVKELIINYDLDSGKWKILSEMVQRVFTSESYLEIT